MIIFEHLEDIENIEPTAVALGNFDGVHLGHQELIRRMKAGADANGLKAAVFTFSNHPKDLLPGAKKVKNILYKQEKEEIIASLGVDYLFNVPFTREIMTTLPQDYVLDLLIGRLRAKALYCGFNHRFGYRAGGDTGLLRQICEEEGVLAEVMEPFEIDGDLVSSSMIRTMIASGQVERCPKYMGRWYAIGGEVVVGNRLGRRLGFPTSNLVIDEDMVTPPNGVYITNCVYAGRRYASVTNVGVKPTVGEYKKNVETHIFDFDKELYGKKITVEFLKKTRDEVKFDDLEELSAQIVRDCREARAYHEAAGTLRK